MNSTKSDFDAAATELLGEEAFKRVAGGMLHQTAVCEAVAMKLLAGEIEAPNEALNVVRQVARRNWLAMQALHQQADMGSQGG